MNIIVNTKINQGNATHPIAKPLCFMQGADIILQIDISKIN